MYPACWLSSSLPLPLAAGVFAPMAILALCIVAGIATVLLLPGKREPAIRGIGGVILLCCFLVFMALLVREMAVSTSADVYFWIFSAIAIISAVRVISSPRPVYSALYFVLTVIASAGLFVMLWAEFMAAALILIYAGAILVTYVFVIMLAQQASTGETAPGLYATDYDHVSREPLLASAVGFALMGIVLFVIFDKAEGLHSAMSAQGVASAKVAASENAIRDLGQYLFTSQLVSMEMAGLILTMAMVGAVIIARRPVGGEAVGHGEVVSAEPQPAEMISAPATPTDDNPHSIPVYGTENPKAKSYPEA